jgi:hypothetical protein
LLDLPVAVQAPGNKPVAIFGEMGFHGHPGSSSSC